MPARNNKSSGLSFAALVCPVKTPLEISSGKIERVVYPPSPVQADEASGLEVGTLFHATWRCMYGPTGRGRPPLGGIPPREDPSPICATQLYPDISCKHRRPYLALGTLVVMTLDYIDHARSSGLAELLFFSTTLSPLPRVFTSVCHL